MNVPDSMANATPDFWLDINKPFLDTAIAREDDIYLATKPEGAALINMKNSDGLSGFGCEVKYLESRGYKFDKDTGKMIKK